MGTKVSITTRDRYRVSVRDNSREVVRTVGIGSSSGGSGASSVGQLTDVDLSDLKNNDVLVYDANTQQFVAKTLPIVNGGNF